MNVKEKIKNSKLESENIIEELKFNQIQKNVIHRRKGNGRCPIHNTQLKVKVLIIKTAATRRYNWGGFIEKTIGYSPKNSFWLLGCQKCSYADYE